jgi:hypothetical protein
VAKLPPVSTTPAANLPLVSTTPTANYSTSFAGSVDTGGKFVTGVNDTGGYLPPVSTTPVVNQRHWRQICHWCKQHWWQTMGTIIKLLTT